MSLLIRAASAAVAAAGWRSARHLHHVLKDPAPMQLRMLQGLLRRNAATEFGQEHAFDAITSWDAFRAVVPLRTYDGFEPWIQRIEDVGGPVLTREPVSWLEPSGGSTRSSKRIPYTDGLVRELGAAVMPWLFDLYRHQKPLRNGRSYWSISPLATAPHTTPSGIAVGAVGDAAYFPACVRPFISRTSAVTANVGRGDIDTCRYRTLQSLLDAPDLAFISVWSPTFLTLLADALDSSWSQLRATASRPLPTRPPTDLGTIWPRLSVISCWTEGHASRALRGMQRRFPRVAIQPKGLLATEGVVSVPVGNFASPVAAVTSHVLEFLEDGAVDRTRLVHELEEAKLYEVVLTTAGGFYRYRLGDVVEVAGFAGATPLLRFVGRNDARSDLVGEKLSAGFVETALRHAEASTSVATTFAMLAPHDDHRGYVLWAEPACGMSGASSAVRRLAHVLDGELTRDHHYGLARHLGQLRAVEPRLLPNAEQSWEAARVAKGQRSGVIKPSVLLSAPFQEVP